MFAGTSGFAYPGWSPRFYPTGIPADRLLAHYAEHLHAVELNNTYYQQPSAAKVAAWLAATPSEFRFVVKAQRGASSRSLVDPVTCVPWLTGPYGAFGERLGCVLFRIPTGVKRDDARLAAFLEQWPGDMPLAIECQDPAWLVDETFDALAAAGAALVATDLPEDPEPPTLRRTGPFLYLRLRRHEYAPAELAVWVARLEPFLASGMDAFVFLRHDPVGRGPELALEFASAVAMGEVSPG